MSNGPGERSRKFYMAVALALALLSQVVFAVDLTTSTKLQIYGGVLFLAGAAFGYGASRPT